MRVVIILVLAVTLEAKEPWAWTIEERIAARTDAAQIARRRDAARARQGAATLRGAATVPEPADALNGGSHPELFLPTEIITSFVASAYSVEDATAEGFREAAAISAAGAGLPADFLDVFEREGATFIDAVKRDRALRAAISSGAVDVERAHAELRLLEEAVLCSSRFALIEQMRELYGTKFDRFLYGGLAPGMARTFFGGRPNAEELRREARGCR